MKTIYLAGPIHGCTDEEAYGWRRWVKQALAGQYGFLDPMDRDYRGVEDENAAEIVEQDLTDIDHADVVLVNAKRPSWGTGMEVWYAGNCGKRVVVVCPGRVYPWLRFCATTIVRDIPRAIAYLDGAS